MRKVVIALLFCAVASAQTTDQGLVEWTAKLSKRVDLQLKVLGEFSYMELELKQLKDERVNHIMDRHLLVIGKYVEQMKALDKTR